MGYVAGAVTELKNVAMAGGNITRNAGSLEQAVAGKEGNSHAYGLETVPYDNYPALLHAGERVLTAREARGAGAESGIHVTITGNNFTVQDKSDIDDLADAVGEKMNYKLQRIARTM